MSNNEKTQPWIEKYRPHTLDQIVSHQYIISTLRQYISEGTFPNLILYGAAGVGKTTLIKACATEMFKDNVHLLTLEINASEERGIDVVRSCITQFSNNTNALTNKFKIQLIILDEADSMTYDAQLALKNVIDAYSRTTRFCLICNCIKKIHNSLISRCVKFRLHTLNLSQMTQRMKYISEQEKVNITNHALNRIISYSHGDLRRAINILQASHTAYSNILIDEQQIAKYLNQLPPETIEKIIHICINNTIASSYQQVNQILQNNSYSLHELLSRLVSYLNSLIISNANKIFDNEQCFKLIRHIGKMEYQLFNNVNTTVLLLSLIGFVSQLKKIDI